MGASLSNEMLALPTNELIKIPSVVLKETFVLNWTRDHVASWLILKGHGQYVNLLCTQHKLDGVGLLLLNENDLKYPPISIPFLGDIKRIIYDIEILKAENIKHKEYNARSSMPQLLSRNSAILESVSKLEMPLKYREVTIQTSETINTEDKIIKNEFVKMLVAFVYLVVVSWVLACVMVIVHERVPDTKMYPPLPDIFLNYLPYVPWAFKLSEICGTVLMALWVIVCVFHKYRTVLCRRFFALLGTAYLLRSITMLITSLSVPGKHIECTPRTGPDSSIMEKLYAAYIIWKGAGLSIQGINTCGDYLFSGHTTVVTFLNFFITEYTPNSCFLLHMLAWIINIVAIGCILASHEHYSIDVFIAFYITSRLFLHYHSLANNQALKQKDSQRVRLWFPLFGYLESSMSGRVPNEFQTCGQIVHSVHRTLVKGLKYVNGSVEHV